MSLGKQRYPILKYTDFRKINLKLTIGGLGFIALVFSAIFAEQLAPRDPVRKFAESQPPSIGTNKLYLKNLSDNQVSIEAVQLKTWYRGKEEERDEVSLFNRVTLKPGQQVHQNFKIHNTGNKGLIKIILTQPTSGDVTIAYRFNGNSKFQISEK